MSEDQPFTPTPAEPLASGAMPGWLIPVATFVAGLVVMALLFGLHVFELGKPAAEPASAPAPLASTKAAPAPAAADTSAMMVREQALSAQLDQLAARLMSIEAGARNAGAYAARAESLMVIQASRMALGRGQPLGYLENQLKLRFGDGHPDAVAAIVNAAHYPVTIEELRSALDPIAPKLVSGNPEEGWWTILRRQLGDLVVLRQESVPSARPSDRLKRARRALDMGQVEPAMAEIARLPGAKNAESWTAAAKRYVDAQHALATLEQAALAPVAPH